jgi:hypothetical protein
VADENKKKFNGPKVLDDTRQLAKMLDELQDSFDHKHKYGWGNDLQHLTADMLLCLRRSQTYTDFHKRANVLEEFLADLDTVQDLLGLIAACCAVPRNKLELVFRKMDEVTPQIKGLRSYFARVASQNSGFMPPPQGGA